LSSINAQDIAARKAVLLAGRLAFLSLPLIAYFTCLIIQAKVKKKSIAHKNFISSKNYK
jgi:hypothetical protein